MTPEEDRQRKNRFTFYMILLVVCIGISFWSGYRLGKTVEALRPIDEVGSKHAVVYSHDQANSSAVGILKTL
jgi:hypothetical protein